jgi:hypothetical protein
VVREPRGGSGRFNAGETESKCEHHKIQIQRNKNQIGRNENQIRRNENQMTFVPPIETFQRLKS